MFKYELGELIHYVRNNKPHNGKVWTRMIVENAHDNWASTAEQKETWTHFGKSRIVYVTCHGEVREDEIISKDVFDNLKEALEKAGVN